MTQTGIDIDTLLATPEVRSASDLLEFFKGNPNRFYTKKMLLDNGFSSNIGRNLGQLTTHKATEINRLWRMSSIDVSNPKNKKQQHFYVYVDHKTIGKKRLDGLMQRCMISISPKSAKTTKKSKSTK